MNGRRWQGVLAMLLFAGCTTTTTKTPMLDLKITNGRIVDGTGSPWFRGDVGVRGDTIFAIGDLADQSARTTIDAHDHIVSPGFIDLLGQSEITALTDPRLEAKVRQGVTTEISAEGSSPGPVAPKPGRIDRWHTFGEFLTVLEQARPSINFALFVGADNPREIVIGEMNRQPTATEMQEMERIVDQAMREGAIGLSTSLIYVPAMYSTTDEIVNLARVAAKYDGVYFSHMRDEGDRIDMGLDEVFRIAREAKISANIWHLKVGGRANWGKMPHVIDRIVAMRAEGLDVAANVYPYAASGTGLSTLAPDWAMEGGYAEFQKRLADPEQRTRIAEALRGQVSKRGERGIFVAQIDNPALAVYQKKFVEQIASEMTVAPEEALIRLFAETKNSPRVIFFSMSEDDMRYALKQPFVSVGSDGGSPTAEQRAANQAVHPRGYGTFPRILARYVREEKLFSLEEAIRKFTSQAADRTHLDDRGILRPGMKADIVVFDAGTIRDVATFDDPHHFSEGVTDVVVNGVPVLREGVMTMAGPGRVLRGKGYRK